MGHLLLAVKVHLPATASTYDTVLPQAIDYTYDHNLENGSKLQSLC